MPDVDSTKSPDNSPITRLDGSVMSDEEHDQLVAWHEYIGMPFEVMFAPVRTKHRVSRSLAKWLDRNGIDLKSNSCCWYCGLRLSRDDPQYSLDHVVPVCRGGTNESDNLVVCCRRCNSSKGAKSLEEYRAHCARRRAVEHYTFAFEQEGWRWSHIP